MDIRGIQSTAEKNTQDIQPLTKILGELISSVQSLLKAQKGLRDLFRSQIEHTMEIQSLKLNVREFSNELHKVNERLNALETHQLTVMAASKARSSLVDAIIKYAPIIVTALLTFISVAAVFTIKELNL